MIVFLHQRGGGIRQVLLDLVYPIGSIYISANNVNPSEFLGGTWEQITDKFLLAAGSTYTAGNTGGSATKTIAKENIPSYTLYSGSHTHTFTGSASSHRHNLNDYSPSGGEGAYVSLGGTASSNVDRTYMATSYTSITPSGTNSGTTITVSSGGSGTALDIMPPYEVVYAWKRVEAAA